jgi:hypothetical protein
MDTQRSVDVASFLGVSKQTVDQITRTDPRFPRPVETELPPPREACCGRAVGGAVPVGHPPLAGASRSLGGPRISPNRRIPPRSSGSPSLTSRAGLRFPHEDLRGGPDAAPCPQREQGSETALGEVSVYPPGLPHMLGRALILVGRVGQPSGSSRVHHASARAGTPLRSLETFRRRRKLLTVSLTMDHPANATTTPRKQHEDHSAHQERAHDHGRAADDEQAAEEIIVELSPGCVRVQPSRQPKNSQIASC